MARFIALVAAMAMGSALAGSQIIPPRRVTMQTATISPQDCDWALKTIEWDIALDIQDEVWYPAEASYYEDVANTWARSERLVLKECGQRAIGSVPSCHEVATWFAWARDVHESYVNDPAYIRDRQWNEEWAARYRRLGSLIGCRGA